MRVGRIRMISHKQWVMVSMYSIVHFLVDFNCAFLMFRYISGEPEAYLCVYLYNFFAFAFQMPLGIIADKCNKNYLFAATGCVLLCAAYGILNAPVAATIILGIGNASFHIGGGIDVLNISDTKMSALGVFVSPGAFGIYWGTLLGIANSPAVMPIALSSVLLAAIAIMIMRTLNSAAYLENAVFSPEKSTSPRQAVFVAACFFFVVCIRSFTGLAMDLPWKSITHWGIALVFATVLGKTTGGFLSDKFGIKRVSVFSLGLAAILFLFIQTPMPGIAAVFLFNMSMPITLWCMARIFPYAKGFSFGVLTFALFLGFLPVYLGVEIPFNTAWLFALGTVISLAFLLMGLGKTKV
ncbi:MAG: hypothetical protein FWH57_03135 [Oscillospiraceae bacterium]|nr:hypothetical protein [Oscillospiraceae bacterium]